MTQLLSFSGTSSICLPAGTLVTSPDMPQEASACFGFGLNTFIRLLKIIGGFLSKTNYPTSYRTINTIGKPLHQNMVKSCRSCPLIKKLTLGMVLHFTPVMVASKTVWIFSQNFSTKASEIVEKMGSCTVKYTEIFLHRDTYASWMAGPRLGWLSLTSLLWLCHSRVKPGKLRPKPPFCTKQVRGRFT